MSNPIRVDDEVLAELDRLAKVYGFQKMYRPLQPNAVLRLLLAIPSKPAPTQETPNG